jgi:hypothetical protein
LEPGCRPQPDKVNGRAKVIGAATFRRRDAGRADSSEYLPHAQISFQPDVLF